MKRQYEYNDLSGLTFGLLTVGYIKGNVQWLHKHINKMKFTYEQDYFLEFCKDVANYKGE